MSKKLSTQEKARRLWVRALRSGKYGWGKQELRPADDRYCCLGILCEVAIKNRVISHYRHHNTAPPQKVLNWVGLNSGSGYFGGDLASSLIDENDSSQRNPFKKIANLIERKPKGLFVEDKA